MTRSTGSADANFNALMAAKVSGDIITQTLDALHDGPGVKKKDGMFEKQDNLYDFQKTVLSAAYLGKGTAISSKE